MMVMVVMVPAMMEPGTAMEATMETAMMKPGAAMEATARATETTWSRTGHREARQSRNRQCNNCFLVHL